MWALEPAGLGLSPGPVQRAPRLSSAPSRGLRGLLCEVGLTTVPTLSDCWG